jgi:hypothetical protein
MGSAKFSQVEKTDKEMMSILLSHRSKDNEEANKEGYDYLGKSQKILPQRYHSKSSPGGKGREGTLGKECQVQRHEGLRGHQALARTRELSK